MNQTEINLRRIRAYNRTLDAWKEDDHPRDKNGRFKKGSGGNALSKLAEATTNKKSGVFEKENEEHEKRTKRNNPYYVDQSFTKGAVYKGKYNEIDANDNVRATLLAKANDIFKHRSGTDYEDFYLVNRHTGKVDGSQTKIEYCENIPEPLRHLGVEYNDEIYKAIAANPQDTYITIHNHPNSTPPSGSDFESAFKHGYYAGIVACHNGTIYYYKVNKDQEFTQSLFDARVENRKKELYNSREEKYKSKTYEELNIIAHEEILDDFSKQYGIRWWKK